MPKITTIGGGTGAPTILKSLVSADFDNIKAVSAAMDSGGKTGVIRSDERDKVIAISDLLRNLISLIPNHVDSPKIHSFTQLISYIDGRNRNLGYRIYYSLLEKYDNSFLKVQEHFEDLLEIEFAGTAIPITLKPTNLKFSTQSGQNFHGEHELDRLSMSKNSVTKVWLEPQVKATPQALKAIKEAQYLIYCPGSLYGSVIANFLPKGVKAALKASQAHKILITNLTSTRNQTHRFTPQDYLKIFQKYTQLKKPFDTIIVPQTTFKQFQKKHPQAAQIYAREHSYFLGWPDSKFAPLKQKDIKIIKKDLYSITPKFHRLRHHPKKLQKTLSQLLK